MSTDFVQREIAESFLDDDEEYWSEVAAEICDTCFGSEDAWLNATHKLAN